MGRTVRAWIQGREESAEIDVRERSKPATRVPQRIGSARNIPASAHDSASFTTRFLSSLTELRSDWYPLPRVHRAMTMRLSLLLSVGLMELGGLALLSACEGSDIPTPTPAAVPDATTDAAAAEALDGANLADAAVDFGCVPVDAGALDAATIKAGLALIQKLECQKCHGQILSGNFDGVQVPGGGVAYPPNLTSDPVTGLGCWTDAQVTNAFLRGIDNRGAVLCPPMPRFADAGVDPASAAAILQFLRSLKPVKNQVPDTPACADVDSGAGDAAPLDGASTEASEIGLLDSGDDGAIDAGAEGPFDSTTRDGGSDSTTDVQIDGAAASTDDGGEVRVDVAPTG
jgi:hypothetical protein